MPTPALDAVDVSWEGVIVNTASPPLDAVSVSWFVPPNTTQTTAQGFISGGVGTPRRGDFAIPIATRAQSFKSGGMGEHEAVYEGSEPFVSFRQRDWVLATRFGVPSMHIEGSGAALGSGWASSRIGTPATAILPVSVGLLSGAVGEPWIATLNEAQSIFDEEIGPLDAAVIARPVMLASAARFGTAVIVRDGHC